MALAARHPLLQAATSDRLYRCRFRNPAFIVVMRCGSVSAITLPPLSAWDIFVSGGFVVITLVRALIALR